MSELTTYGVAPAEATVTYLDPTGGRLISWAQAAQAANALAKSLVTTTFVPAGETVGNATAKILMGDELGLSPIASLRSIYVVHGTPALYARSMVALALSHGHLIWTEETTDAKVVVCGQRRGSDHIERSEWTIARATKAGYTNNKKYASTPQEMLYAKAAGEVARKIAADTLAGIPYSVEDLELEQQTTRPVARAATPATPKRVARAAKPEPDEPPLDDEPAEPAQEDAPPELEHITEPQSKKMHALLREQGLTDRDAALIFVGQIIGRDLDTTKDMTKAEASNVIDTLEAGESA